MSKNSFFQKKVGSFCFFAVVASLLGMGLTTVSINHNNQVQFICTPESDEQDLMIDFYSFSIN